MKLEDKIKNIIDNSGGDISVVFKNLKNNYCININENKVFPSASTIKLVIMATFLKKVRDGLVKLEDNIVLLNSHKCGGDGILKELNEGHIFTYKEIITFMIIISDNTATNILIDFLGMDEINSMAESLNLKHTRIKRKMMDSEAVKQGMDNFTTAKDLASFLTLLYNKEIINENYSYIMLEILKRQQVKGRLDLYLPEDLCIAHKTGDLDRLEHDVGIVYTKNINYIICVLTSNIDNKNGREFIGRISKQIYDNVINS
ncbi:serine hydrolase [Clostridium rectalis]|uniref:serine hydrolase n=1 Tax=Clostridium rectalis TaxID=2040295 RepID=UPI000F63498B|nr:serine hydrolase [Clostridium rectalis]